MSEWQKIGDCAVDSGQIIIVDPCYVIPDRGENPPEVVYEDILDTWDYKKRPPQRYTPFKMGVIVSSGYGDGYYPVYAKFNSEGRLLKAMIDFDDESPYEDEDY
jgi:hypothetical protein